MAFRPTLEKKEEKERVRAALLRAALQLGAVHGFSSVGLREVAREAGIAPTSFYRHFADMEELGLALVRELVGRCVRAIGERAAAATRESLVPALVDATLAAVEQDPALLRFIVSERVGASTGLRALLRSELALLAETLRSVLARTGIEAVAADETVPLMAADAALALLLEGCVRALDGAASVRATLLWGLGRLLGMPRSTDPEVAHA
jgi:AcrR family transcriptional regulator